MSRVDQSPFWAYFIQLYMLFAVSQRSEAELEEIKRNRKQKMRQKERERERERGEESWHEFFYDKNFLP
jgi:hypothetical protein